MRHALREHLKLTTAEAVARLTGNWSADVRAFDKVHTQALAMADMLSAGIISQFPQRWFLALTGRAAGLSNPPRSGRSPSYPRRKYGRFCRRSSAGEDGCPPLSVCHNGGSRTMPGDRLRPEAFRILHEEDHL